MSPLAEDVAVVTGAFGHTGQAIARRLLDAGWTVRTLTRDRQRPDPFGGRVEAFPLRFDREADLAPALAGASVLYNTYWMRFAHGASTFDRAVENTRRLLAAARAAGVRRVVHVSITSADPASPLPYFRGKGQAEAAVRASGLSWAILRPAVLFGPSGIVLHQLAWMLRHVPAFPVFGSGRYPVQPVHVEDLAALAVEAGAGSAPVTRDAVGPDTYAFTELLARLGRAVGRTPPLVHLPPRLVLWGAACLGLALHDVVISWDEIAGIMAGHFASADPPTGRISLDAWLTEHGAALGAGPYRSEIRTHYR